MQSSGTGLTDEQATGVKRGTIKSTFTVSFVFALLRAGHISHEQAMALLTEIERKPLWMRFLGL